MSLGFRGRYSFGPIKESPTGVTIDSNLTLTGNITIETAGGTAGSDSALVVNSTSSYQGIYLNAPGGQNVFVDLRENDVKKGSIETVVGLDYTYVGAFNGHVLYLGSSVDAGESHTITILTNGNVGINEKNPDYKLDVNGTFGFTPGSSVTPVDNGDVVIEFTNNTTLTFKAKGSDGTVRSATLTLS